MLNKILLEEYQKILNQLEIQKFKNKSILITGANGLIGSYLVDFLDYASETFDLGIQIYAMSRSLNKLKQRFSNLQNVILVEQDLNLPLKSNVDFDFIIHAASNAHPLAYSTDPVGTMKTNLIGTINLLDNIKNSNCKFLYISTGEIYGNNTDKAFEETDIGLIDTKSVRSCYPVSKCAAETICYAYAQQYGIKMNIARLCYVYGASITNDNSRADAQFLRNALDGKDIVLKSLGLQKRTYCYVADVVCALLFILTNSKDNEVYNIANPNSIVSIKEYASTLAEISNVQLKFEIPDEIEARGYSKQADSILNASKLMSLGWKPVYKIDEGLKNTFNIKKVVQ